MDPDANEYNVHEAKTHFSKLLDRVENGEEITIKRAGHPIAKVVPLDLTARRSSFGMFADSIVLHEGWDSPETNAELAREWGEDA
ncbi:type II toxin-antitoxin system Phd/YefM family antitoxin [Tsukamurella hominis]|uniref:type II toxin-antitoxin system Phd/YefM family antitoxin n=1 Tax=Tsukamurella hominis TaxID=1970232 RepID=UPI0039E762EA